MEQVVSFLFKYRAALFSKGQFGFGARPPAWVVFALIIGLALFIYFLYIRSSLRLPAGWRLALIAFRCALIALIVICLMRPVIVVPSVIPQSSYVVVLMDDSASMLLADEGARSRLDAVKQLMTATSPFYAALADKFKVRAFKFSATAARVQEASELEGTGQRTDIASAIEQAARDSAGLPISAVIVMSDGASNAGDPNSDFAATLNNLRARGLPVFAVGFGRPTLEGDVELIRASAARRALAGSAVTAELLLRASGSQKSVRIDITEDSHALRSQEVPLQAEAVTVARITFTPSSPGLHRYTFTAAPGADEPIAENNSQEILIEVEDSHPKILYIEGEPRWEYGKLRAALSEEKNIALVSALRSADGKFYRQGVESGEELAAGFPTSEEELFKYDAIILGSIEATFFSFDQLRALEQFVSRRGGTLLALGGLKSFNAGGYANTPIADLLPVYLNGESATAGESQSFKAGPSERGRDHPAARLADQSEANQKAWEQMPALTLPETLTQIKPGATVVLDARSAREKNRVVPLLVEERYGRGRTFALLASDTWRWRMMLESKNTSFETFWRNLLRYSVESVRRRVEVQTERSFNGAGEPVQIRAEIADEKFINVNDAQPSAQVTTPTGRAVEVALKPVIEGGFEGYAGAFVPDEDGLYRVELTTRRGGSQQSALNTAQTSFIAGPLNREAHNAAQNRDLLKRIAADTGGNYYAPDQSDNLIEDITHTDSGNSVRVAYDLWDMPVNFMLVVALAAAEWFIRKRKGLA